MPFCTKCGASIDENTRFCSACGAPVEQQQQPKQEPVNNTQQNEPQYQQNNQQNNQQAQYQQNPQQNTQYQQPNQDYYRNPDGSYTYTGPVNEEGMFVSDVNKNKYLNILSYIGILFLIPLFCAKGSKYTRFHVNQGIVLTIFSVAYSIVKAIVMAILKACLLGGYDYLYYFSPLSTVYSVINTILSLASLVFTALAIYGIYNTCTGKCKELPVIGKIRILK